MQRHLVKGLLHQQRIGAEHDMTATIQHPFDQIKDGGVEQRFATGDGDHRRRAFVH